MIPDLSGAEIAAWCPGCTSSTLKLHLSGSWCPWTRGETPERSAVHHRSATNNHIHTSAWFTVWNSPGKCSNWMLTLEGRVKIRSPVPGNIQRASQLIWEQFQQDRSRVQPCAAVATGNKKHRIQVINATLEYFFSCGSWEASSLDLCLSLGLPVSDCVLKALS